MTLKEKAAIYHFTNESQKRPKIYKDQLTELEQYASSLGFTVDAIYCDKSLKKSDHIEFKRFMNNCNRYDALITKDFYHISKNTMKAISIIKELNDKGIQVYTKENGYLSFEKAPFEKQQNIATYCCRLGNKSDLHEILPVQNDILTLFSRKKTKWTVTDQYFDESALQKDGEQPQLVELLENKDKYDLLLIHNSNDIHWRTSKFCELRDQLQLDIYSLQEGFIPFRKEE